MECNLRVLPLTRREALRDGLFSAAGVFLGCRGLGAAPVAAAGGKAKSVIQIWMWGGPAHLDTFDPKPEAGEAYCGPLKTPIETNVSGMRICELLPQLARQAHRYSLIRSMTHGINAHETASYAVQTGRVAGGHDVYPSVGAVVSLFKGYRGGYKGMIPPYIVLTQPQGRFSEEGFLGPRYKPFATGGDPAKAQFAVEGIVAEDMTEERQRERREYLHQLDTLAQVIPQDARPAGFEEAERQAYELILGDEGKVFDLSREPDALRDRYGRTTFGQSCLAARRLVERGVPYVTINYQGGWDTHKQNFIVMRRRLPEMDKGLATLIDDLAERGLLDTTIVWWNGEFGRTPKVDWGEPWNGGRGHWGSVFSALVAGGGFKGGHVVGASDARGETVRDRPVYPADLIASMYELLGIDPRATLPHPLGAPAHVSPAPGDGLPLGGRLKEIL